MIHRWSLQDNEFVINHFIRHCKTTDCELLISRIATHIGTTKSSIKQKLLNMLFIVSNGQKGLSNYSEDSKIAVFNFLNHNRHISIEQLQFLLS